jgi:hypothetical protein
MKEKDNGKQKNKLRMQHLILLGQLHQPRVASQTLRKMLKEVRVPIQRRVVLVYQRILMCPKILRLSLI